jgi:hypothetical protein
MHENRPNVGIEWVENLRIRKAQGQSLGPEWDCTDTGFVGHVLSWGLTSFCGGTVITNPLSLVSYVGGGGSLTLCVTCIRCRQFNTNPIPHRSHSNTIYYNRNLMSPYNQLSDEYLKLVQARFLPGSS